MEKVTVNDEEFGMDVVANLMDRELCEEIHFIGANTEQEFVDMYVQAHLKKFGEEFIVN